VRRGGGRHHHRHRHHVHVHIYLLPHRSRSQPHTKNSTTFPHLRKPHQLSTFFYTECTMNNDIQLKNRLNVLRWSSGCLRRSARTPYRQETYRQPRVLHTFPTNLSCTFTQQWGIPEVSCTFGRRLRQFT